MQNIEIKARWDDFDEVHERIAALDGRWHETLKQRDVYFHVPGGRLKLRLFDEGQAQLIFYQRDDTDEPRRSEYEIYPVSHPNKLERLLARALGVRAIVEKTREVYLVDNVRVHLDEVVKLGRFLELEAVLSPEHDTARETEKVYEFLHRFGIPTSALIAKSYIDLLEVD